MDSSTALSSSTAGLPWSDDSRAADAWAASSRRCAFVSETVCVPMMQTYNGGPALCSVGLLEVHLDDRLLRERLVAQRALERALSGVHNLMPHELRESV